MYAIAHAATTLAIRRRVPEASMWAVLVGVQAVELLWIALSLAGIERASIHGGRIALDFLPYSHSVTSGVVLAALTFAATVGTGRPRRVAWALAVAVFSHIVLDVVHHQRDIRLIPADWGPRLGTGLLEWPWLDLVLELAYCLACAWLARGGPALYAGMVILNIANLPTMLQLPAVVAPVAAHPTLLPILILAQIVITWLFIARFGRTAQRGPR